jgi:hypothetical protein
VQLRHECPLSGEAYVARSAWRDASLAVCPRHPRGGCGLVRHGTYPRRTPTGMRIARYYCPTAHETFSLLPDCLASHFPGALDAIEQVVATVEASRSVEAAADVLPRITLPSAVGSASAAQAGPSRPARHRHSCRTSSRVTPGWRPCASR